MWSDFSLKTLLGQRLFKGNVRMSNREQALSDDQVCYGCVGPSPCVSYLTQFFFCLSERMDKNIS